MTGHNALRRFLVLLALRWFPVGLCIPVGVLLPFDRGLTLAQIGLAASAQGIVVLLLELPTGGLSDAWGRRPVLLLASGVGAASTALLVVADSLPLFAAAFLLQGCFRALDSGPLEAWYVDATLTADRDVRLARGLGAGATMIGLSIGAGALTSGAAVAWLAVPGVPALVLPVLLALLLQLAGLVAIALLVREPSHPEGRRTFASSLRGVPAVIAGGTRLVRRSRVLAALLAVELCWGFGMVTFEALMPVRLAGLVGGTEAAAAIVAPASAAAWLISAAGAALLSVVSGRLGVAVTAGLLRIAQGLAVLGMGLLAGPAGVLTGFLACYFVHGASNALHQTLLHRQVDTKHRTTVMSMNSMMAQPAGALGLIVLTALAGATSVSLAIVVGAVVLALAAPLYLPAARAERNPQLAPERTVGSPSVVRR